METEKVKNEKSARVTNFIVIETFAGKRELKDIIIDLLCLAHGKEAAYKKSA